MYGMAKLERTAAIAIVAGALLVVAGCGATTTAGGQSSAPQRAIPVSRVVPSVDVDVTLKEYSIVIAKQDLSAGTYTFMLHNEGAAPHGMAIEGPGIDPAKQSKIINPGQRTKFTVTLKPGTYEVWCPVDGHRAEGMHTTLTVM